MSLSPPRTPGEPRLSLPKASTPTSDDSSIIDDLSFDYVTDSQGNLVRLSKGSSSKSNHSSPPTPQDPPLQPDPPGNTVPPSPDILVSPVGRVSLSRSESASALGGQHAQNDKPARSFQRTASGPVNMGSAPSYLAPTASSLSKPRVAARRVTAEEPRTRQTIDTSAHPYTLQEEKENISESEQEYVIQTASVATKPRSSPPLVTRSMSSAATRSASSRGSYLTGGSSSANSRPLADVPVPQRPSYSSRQIQILPGPNRAGRIMKSTSVPKYINSTNFDRISEAESHSESEHAGGRYSPIHVPPSGDETEPEDEPAVAVDPAAVPLPSSNPSASHMVAPRVRNQSGLSVNINAALTQSGSSRPRRSASLSEALKDADDYQLQVQHQYQGSISRPGTSLGTNAENRGGARRVTTQQREKQDQELKAEYEKYDGREPENPPSPTHQQYMQSSRSAYGHRRRDSDTLRGLAPPVSATSIGSPTVVESHRNSHSPPLASRLLQGRYSPPGQQPKGRVSPPTAIAKGRSSPSTSSSAKGRVSPPTRERESKGRLSPPSGKVGSGREIAKHRRSPTAPEPSSSKEAGGAAAAAHPVGKTWAGVDKGEREEDYEHGGAVSSGERERDRDRERGDRERDRERERERKGHQSHMSLQHPTQPPQYSQSAPSLQNQAPAQAMQPASAQLNRHIVVNKKAYARLDMIGKGGSSRVFRVLNHANELYAIKRVSLDKTDAETMNGYMNEIALLKRLEGNSRIIRLIDSEVKPGPGGSKGHLLLVMECGEIDLARLLQEQMREPVNMVWVAYYWQQMLQAVHVIHEEKIVHSDLKPANFVLVKGQLKLIDFGIANAIANDTTNIQRDHQIGTVNYMSPEAIELPDGMRRLKVGRPSDVWSLGCILYQMVYGQPPFQHLSVYQKMKAIPDLTHVIDFPEYAVPLVPSPRSSTGGGGQGQVVEPPRRLDHLKQRVRKDVIMSMKSCLCRNPKERATIPQLLNDMWLANAEPAPTCAKDVLKENETVINPYYMRQLLEYGIRLAADGGADMSPDALLKDAERLVQELKAVQQ